MVQDTRERLWVEKDTTAHAPSRASAAPGSKIPFWVKLVYHTFVVVLMTVYWRDYGPTNFLYFCDVALILSCVAVWMESAVLVSACAVGIVLPQVLWQADFLAVLCGGEIVGTTYYMFDPNIQVFTRFLSFFHFWLPLFLLWLTYKLGYDRRGALLWAGLAAVILWICYLWMPAPPPPNGDGNIPVNINYVYGLSLDKGPQTWMPEWQWFALVFCGLPLCFYLPSHLLFSRLFRSADS